MSKYFKILSLCILIILSMSISSFAVTMYAPDGRTLDVTNEEVEVWKNVGWYEYPVSAIYAPDGRTAVVTPGEVEAYTQVGWYTVPVMPLYSLDGRIVVVAKTDANAYIGNEWYAAPVALIYSPLDGSTAVVYRDDVQAYQNVGWYDLYSPYCAKIREYANAVKMDIESFLEKYPDDSSINSLMVRYNISYGGSISYTLYDIDHSGIPELVFIKDNQVIDVYTIHNGDLVKVFPDCYFGDRSRLHILADGTFLNEGSSGASTSAYELLQFASDGYNLIRKEACYYDGTGPNDYMSDCEYLSPAEYNKRLEAHMNKSIFSTFLSSELFE